MPGLYNMDSILRWRREVDEQTAGNSGEEENAAAVETATAETGTSNYQAETSTGGGGDSTFNKVKDSIVNELKKLPCK